MFYDKFKALCKENGISCTKAALQIGLSNATPTKWKKTGATPDGATLTKIADYFHVSVDYLVGNVSEPYFYLDNQRILDEINSYDEPSLSAKNIIPLPKTKRVPLIGTIACGTPIMAEENIEGYLQSPENIHADFCLRCEGDSMINARIMDGDIVYIRQQPDVEDGQIAAVLIDDEATLKRVYHNKDGGCTLAAENPAFAPMTFTAADCVEIRILGKAVAFLSCVK